MSGVWRILTRQARAPRRLPLLYPDRQGDPPVAPELAGAGDTFGLAELSDPLAGDGRVEPTGGLRGVHVLGFAWHKM